MKVIINGVNMVLQWNHHKRKGKPSRWTTCKVLICDSGWKPTEEIASAEIKRLSTDPPCREKARKYSLAKAIGTNSSPKDRFPINVRKQIWDAYRLRPRPKNKKEYESTELPRVGRKETERPVGAHH